MNKVNLSLLGIWFYLVGSSMLLQGQTVAYSDNFENGCGSGCLATSYGGWTVTNNVGGTNGGDPNIWYVSCAEEGKTGGVCGSGCSSGDESLHIGAGGLGDMGASFNETGASNRTYRRVQSPVIDLSAYGTNTITFTYIAYGSSGCSDDYGQLWLSTDGGATWPSGYRTCLTSMCCGGVVCDGYTQGLWTTYSAALPAAFDFNSNVRVGFYWRNNGNGSGTDPSIAINNLQISSSNPVLPVGLSHFDGRVSGEGVLLNWTTESEFGANNFEIMRSRQPSGFEKIGEVPARNNSRTEEAYSFPDKPEMSGVWYYRLRTVDTDGSTALSEIVRIETDPSQLISVESIKANKDDGEMIISYYANATTKVAAEVVDVSGKRIALNGQQDVQSGLHTLSLNIHGISSGVYFVKMRSLSTPQGYSPASIVRKIRL